MDTMVARAARAADVVIMAAPRGRLRRGQFLPPTERGYVVGDYYRYHLRRPPPGYYWYRSGGDFVLAATASGLIFEVVAGDGY